MLRWSEHGQDLLLEAPVVDVHDVQGHLDGRPVVGLAEHLEVDRRVLVAGEAEVADLAVLERLEAGVDGAVLGEDPVGVVVVDHLVELPEVEAVGLEAAEAVLEVRTARPWRSGRRPWS